MLRKSSNLRVVQGRAAADGVDEDVEALFADIAAFDIDAARRRVQEADAKANGLRVSSNPTADKLPEVDLSPAPVWQAAEPAPPPGAKPSAPVEALPASGSGLLDQLRSEVVSHQRRASDLSRRVDAARDCLDRRLRSVFEYLHDFTTQLNYLKPEVTRDYYFLGADEAFRNLRWLEGYSDFRTQAESDGGRIERVSFGYTLQGAGERTLERTGCAVERLRQVLFDLGLRFECLERRNAQRELEHASFRIADEIKVRVVWRADFEQQQVVVESRNLERLGFASGVLAADDIGPALLDEFGRLVLGRPNAFRGYLLRQPGAAPLRPA